MDYAKDSGAWHAAGFDSGKHLFSTVSSGYIKIKNLGEDDPWSFKDQCGPIDDYLLIDSSDLCQNGAEDRPGHCGKVLFIDYSTLD